MSSGDICHFHYGQRLEQNRSRTVKYVRTLSFIPVPAACPDSKGASTLVMGIPASSTLRAVTGITVSNGEYEAWKMGNKGVEERGTEVRKE